MLFIVKMVVISKTFKYFYDNTWETHCLKYIVCKIGRKVCILYEKQKIYNYGLKIWTVIIFAAKKKTTFLIIHVILLIFI